MKEITPEEKLLRLIKQDKKDGSKPKMGLLVNRGRFPLFKLIYFGLLPILSIIFLLFLWDFLILKNRISKIETSVSEARSTEPIEAQLTKELPSLPEIEELVQKKSIFAPVADVFSSADKEIRKEGQSESLKLLGIITGIKPQAIIEDSSLKKTYFLYKGDTFGEYKVLQIKEGKVILERRGEEMELNM